MTTQIEVSATEVQYKSHYTYAERGCALIEEYLTGNLSEASRADFIDHVADCSECFDSIVLWNLTQCLEEKAAKAKRA